MTVNFDQDLILIIGASGRIASSILPSLSQRWKRLRLVCNSDTSSNRLSKDYPGAEVVKVDLAEPSACRALLTGVTTVFHIGPPFHPHESEIGYNVIDAAVLESEAPDNNFQHFVYSSVLQSIFRKMMNHDQRTLLFYNRKGLIGNPSALEMVLGRKTTSFEKWVKDIIGNETET